MKDNIESFKDTSTGTVYPGNIIKSTTEDTVTVDLSGESQTYDKDLFTRIFEIILMLFGIGW